jgi:hypothetical protein
MLNACLFFSSMVPHHFGYIAPSARRIYRWKERTRPVPTTEARAHRAATRSATNALSPKMQVVHIMDQRELSKGEGPIGCIAAPTRELAHQIMGETKKFSKPYHLVVCGVYGGMSKLDQIKMLKSGVEVRRASACQACLARCTAGVCGGSLTHARGDGGGQVVVCTPGRLIDMIKAKACSMRRTTYLVLDEVDRMFDQGFEPQVRIGLYVAQAAPASSGAAQTHAAMLLLDIPVA